MKIVIVVVVTIVIIVIIIVVVVVVVIFYIASNLLSFLTLHSSESHRLRIRMLIPASNETHSSTSPPSITLSFLSSSFSISLDNFSAFSLFMEQVTSRELAKIIPSSNSSNPITPPLSVHTHTNTHPSVWFRELDSPSSIYPPSHPLIRVLLTLMETWRRDKLSTIGCICRDAQLRISLIAFERVQVFRWTSIQTNMFKHTNEKTRTNTSYKETLWTCDPSYTNQRVQHIQANTYNQMHTIQHIQSNAYKMKHTRVKIQKRGNTIVKSLLSYHVIKRFAILKRLKFNRQVINLNSLDCK